MAPHLSFCDGSFHLACFHVSSILQHVPEYPPLERLNSIPSFARAAFFLFIHLSMVVSLLAHLVSEHFKFPFGARAGSRKELLWPKRYEKILDLTYWSTDHVCPKHRIRGTESQFPAGEGRTMLESPGNLLLLPLSSKLLY